MVLRDGENLTCGRMGERGVSGSPDLGKEAQRLIAAASCLLRPEGTCLGTAFQHGGLVSFRKSPAVPWAGEISLQAAAGQAEAQA